MVVCIIYGPEECCTVENTIFRTGAEGFSDHLFFFGVVFFGRYGSQQGG
jgi:hypothetical protein